MNLKVGGNIVMVGKGKKIVAGKDTGREAIVIGVVEKKPLSKLKKYEIISKKIRGKETDVVQMKIPQLLVKIPKESDRTSKWRPAPGGVSIGHHDITAGTLGMVVNKYGLNKYILSNNHVLANVNKAKIGDAILQPGAADGGTMADTIATLHKYVPIETVGLSSCPFMKVAARLINFWPWIFGRKTRQVPTIAIENLVDCALAKPLNQDDIREDILEIGTPSGIAEPEIDMAVAKSGRTTGLTSGKIIAVEAIVQVFLGDGIGIFTDQIAMTHMLEGGDSGSLLVTEKDNKLVGLCFAGSDSMSLANKISNVFDALKISL